MTSVGVRSKLEVGDEFWQGESESVREFLERGQSWIVPASLERGDGAERNSRFVREVGSSPVSGFAKGSQAVRNGLLVHAIQNP